MLAYTGSTAAYGRVYQHYQSWKFDRQIAAPPSTKAAAAIETPLDLLKGDLLGKVEIPRLGISVAFFHGVENETLIGGAGHVPGTPLPGAGGNAVIAAHRDTFFRKLEGIVPGDTIQVSTLTGAFEYIVDSVEIVEPEDTRVMESRSRTELTLITCYPFYFVGSAPKRFVVHARPGP